MNITVLSVGKLKEAYWKDALEEYGKRLSRYARLRFAEVEDEKTSEAMTEKETAILLKKEGERILQKVGEKTHIIALAIKGKSFSSEEMAEHLGELMSGCHSDLTFVIGGSLGLSDEVLNRADEAWSFSELTFPHQIMRVILLEQIYRSFRILNHEPYHK